MDELSKPESGADISVIDDAEKSFDGFEHNPRKRRKSRREIEKKYTCSFQGCGKTYSRAEHLHRHELNHAPKHIYHCDFPGCPRYFVRQDLCIRHRERHTARGSQLQRKDALFHSMNPLNGTVSNANGGEEDMLGRKTSTGSATSPRVNDPTPRTASAGNIFKDPFTEASIGLDANSMDANRNIATAINPTSEIHSVNARNRRWTNHSQDTARKMSLTAGQKSDTEQVPLPGGTFDTRNRHASFGQMAAIQPSLTTSQDDSKTYNTFPGVNSADPQSSPYPAMYHTTPSPSTSNHSQNYHHHHLSPNRSANGPSPTALSQTFAAQHKSPLSHSMDPHAYQPQVAGQMAFTGGSNDALFTSTSPTTLRSTDAISFNQNITVAPGIDPDIPMDPVMAPYSVPMLGQEGYSRSPFSLPEDFTMWLFNDENSAASNGGVVNGETEMSNFYETFSLQYEPYALPDFGAQLLTDDLPEQHPMAVQSLLDSAPQISTLSEEKRRDILELFDTRFTEIHHSWVFKRNEELLEGNRDSDTHILSLRMMQAYIASFWAVFHPQVPILHQPTFAAEKVPNSLLLSIMAIGAASLDKSYGEKLTESAADLANLLAWHLRWLIFSDPDFGPPAKLWVFQSLILLEIYEKMFSTRPLHERAHIHHATTLTLMRRGSSLTGSSTLDTPASRDDKYGGSVNGAQQNSTNSAVDEWWQQWIKSESTRRAAFTAFVLDTTHAAMFGHSAVLATHEMRLPLPCGEDIWSAKTAAEARRIEANLHTKGIKPVNFLDGLKRTLNKQNVPTNSFGRTVIMAGLLSVNWHMNQRDLQVSSLGAFQALGGKDKWRAAVARAIDFWKEDFDNLDKSIAKNKTELSGAASTEQPLEENVFQSRLVFHHLAHIAINVDIIDCQIYAGVGRLLGKTVTPQDFASVQRRVKNDWAPTARARDAVFYALRYLSKVLLNSEDVESSKPGNQLPSPSDWSAKDDILLYRPWIVFLSCVVLFAYNYALDGAVSPSYLTLRTSHEKSEAMRVYLHKFTHIKSPDQLLNIPGRSSCAGVLLVVSDQFNAARWELLREAADLLRGCAAKLQPSR